MKFSLIVCTYMRPDALENLLKSVAGQTLYPDEIVIVDGSTNELTAKMIEENPMRNLAYHLVAPEHRGLTRQRNFGIANAADDCGIICFLDDDTVLEADYFAKLIETYDILPDALGAGGFITNESLWQKVGSGYKPQSHEFTFDGWKREEPLRFRLRKKFDLDANVPPGCSPDFSHGRSLSFLPPSGNAYKTEQLIGCTCSFRKSVFNEFSFSDYFEGYGLYEDADFTLRVSKTGPLYSNTAARLAHYHHESGRPNRYRYGKMVVRNGWYVWRVKNPKPSFKARFKWHAITFLLAGIRFSNIFTSARPKAAFTESAGRIAGWFSLFFNRPGK